jgi:recombination protein RecT
MAETKETKEVAVKQTFDVVIMDKLTANEDALPKDFNKTRFTQNCIAVLKDNSNLSNMLKTPQGKAQVLSGLMKGAFLGLDFFNKEAHLIPFGSTVQFIPDFRGSRKLVKKYSIKPVDDVDSFVVREGDKLDVKVVGGVKTFDFEPIPLNNGTIVGAFAYVRFEDGSVKWEMMNIDELEAARSQSKAKNSPSWSKFTSEMYRKTVLHRLCKNIDLDFESNQQRDLFISGNEIETDKVMKVKADNPFADDVQEDIVVDAEVIEEGADNAENA